MRNLHCGIAVLTAWNVCSAAMAGTAIQFHTDSGKDKGRVAVDGAHLKIKAGTADDPDIRYDDGKGTLTVVDHRSKTYMRLTKADIAKMMTMASKMQDRMQSMLAKLPPEQREMIKRRLKGRMNLAAKQKPPKTTFKKVGNTARIAGTKCVYYHVTYGKEKTLACLASFDAVGITGRERKTVNNLIRLLSGLSRSPGAAKFSAASGGEEFIRRGLLPLESKSISGGSKRTFRVQKIANATLGKSERAIPAGYKPRKLPRAVMKQMSSGS